jgi:hypothetical protein
MDVVVELAKCQTNLPKVVISFLDEERETEIAIYVKSSRYGKISKKEPSHSLQYYTFYVLHTFRSWVLIVLVHPT